MSSINSGFPDYEFEKRMVVTAPHELRAIADPLRGILLDVRGAAPLRAIRSAVTDRAATERRIAEAVVAARDADVSWAAIGGMLGTSGEAARKRYGTQRAKTA